MNRGYVLVWRKIQDSGLMQMPNTLAVFLHLLFSATHQTLKVGTTTGVVELQRGQYISGLYRLSKDLKQSVQQIRTSLARLEQLEIISIKSTSKYSIYTIENYDIYQDANKLATNKQQTNNKQTTTKQTQNTQNTQKYTPPIPSELLSEWLVIRKRKPVTERVFKKICTEADKLKWTPEQAIIHCCENSWQGFEASWVKSTETVKTGWTPKGNQL